MCQGLLFGFILGLGVQNAALIYFILKLDWEDEANDVRPDFSSVICSPINVTMCDVAF